MSDDSRGNPKWLAVTPTIKDRYLSNLASYPRLNENEQNMMGDLHKLIDDVASLRQRNARLEETLEAIGEDANWVMGFDMPPHIRNELKKIKDKCEAALDNDGKEQGK